jgi:hypothetical protein
MVEVAELVFGFVKLGLKLLYDFPDAGNIPPAKTDTQKEEERPVFDFVLAVFPGFP